MNKVLKWTGWWGIMLAFLVSEISIAIAIYLRAFYCMSIPLLIYAGFFTVWLVFYMTGVYLGRFSDRAYNLSLPLLIVLIGLILSQMESSYLVSHYGTGYGVKPSSFLYAFGIILFLFSSRTEKIIRKLLGDSNKILIYVGNISFAIYLVARSFGAKIQWPLVSKMGFYSNHFNSINPSNEVDSTCKTS